MASVISGFGCGWGTTSKMRGHSLPVTKRRLPYLSHAMPAESPRRCWGCFSAGVALLSTANTVAARGSRGMRDRMHIKMHPPTLAHMHF